jgi:hypothetical protein
MGLIGGGKEIAAIHIYFEDGSYNVCRNGQIQIFDLLPKAEVLR